MFVKRTPEQIDAAIRRKIIVGNRPADIAQYVGKPTGYVRERMAAMGLGGEPGAHDNVYQIHPMWKLDDVDERRMAIWQRQHDGAVKTLSGRL